MGSSCFKRQHEKLTKDVGLQGCGNWHAGSQILQGCHLRKGTAEGKRRQTLCDKRDNNSVWKQFPPNFTFLLKDLFVKDPNTVILFEHHNKHAGHRPVTFVTRKRFAVLLRKLTITGWGPGISLCYCLLRARSSATITGNKRKYNQKVLLSFSIPRLVIACTQHLEI